MTTKLTKKQRAEREEALALAISMGLTAVAEEQAKAWACKAQDLRDGLSATAIKRAVKRAHEMADERPPGWFKAMAAMDEFDRLCKHHEIPKRAQDAIWGAIAQFCMFQLGAAKGAFYDAARCFGLASPRSDAPIVLDRPRTLGCSCPNCRPRRAEELN